MFGGSAPPQGGIPFLCGSKDYKVFQAPSDVMIWDCGTSHQPTSPHIRANEWGPDWVPKREDARRGPPKMELRWAHTPSCFQTWLWPCIHLVPGPLALWAQAKSEDMRLEPIRVCWRSISESHLEPFLAPVFGSSGVNIAPHHTSHVISHFTLHHKKGDVPHQ